MSPRDRKLSRSDIEGRMGSRWNPFPNVSTQGSYTHFNQQIRLAGMHSSQFELAFKKDDFDTKLALVPLLDHELQHLIDHTSTVWGRNNLVRIFNAYNIRANRLQSKFGNITALLRELKSLHYAEYYTEYYDAAYEDWDGKPWSYGFSSGLQLGPDGNERSDLPISFTIFSKFNSSDRIIRIPFSVASLLEMNAMCVEIQRTAKLLSTCQDVVTRKIEEGSWLTKLDQMVFDPIYAIYSVAAHYVSNMLKTKDIPLTYAVGATIATFCLNFPSCLFSKVKVPEAFEAYGDRKEAFLKREDRGFLFQVLIENGKSIPITTIQLWLEKVLERSGLPPFEEIKEKSDEESRRAIDAAIEGPFKNRLIELLTLGDIYRTAANPWPLPSIRPMNGFPIPAILTQDDKFVTMAGGPNFGSFNSPGEWHDQAFAAYRLLEEYIEACVT